MDLNTASPEDREKAFKSSLWKLYSNCVIDQFREVISSAVSKTYSEAKEQGITNFQDWMQYKLDNYLNTEESHEQ